jgi:hypothetical protein
MARILKLQQIDVLTDRDTAERAVLYFDRNYNDFVAIVGTEEVRDKTADGCKNKAWAALKAFKPYTWKPFIFVDEVKDRTHYGNGRRDYVYRVKLSFEFWRSEMAQKKDGHWLERPFLEDGLTDSDREPHSPFMSDELVYPTKDRLEDCRKSNKKDRENGSDIKPGGYGKEQASNAYRILPYTEETWLALKVMHQKLLAFQDQLDALTKSKDFEKKLFNVAKNLKLLPEKT